MLFSSASCGPVASSCAAGSCSRRARHADRDRRAGYRDDLRVALEVVEVNATFAGALPSRTRRSTACAVARGLQEAHLADHERGGVVTMNCICMRSKGMRLGLRVVAGIDDPNGSAWRSSSRRGLYGTGRSLEQQRVDEPLEMRLARRDADVGGLSGVIGSTVLMRSSPRRRGNRWRRSKTQASKLCSPASCSWTYEPVERVVCCRRSEPDRRDGA